MIINQYPFFLGLLILTHTQVVVRLCSSQKCQQHCANVTCDKSDVHQGPEQCQEIFDNPMAMHHTIYIYNISCCMIR